jgi:hypothetical protein
METKIEIHDDHCLNIKKEEVQNILDQVTALVTAAILRVTAQTEDTDGAA